jgi:hypothetical protein
MKKHVKIYMDYFGYGIDDFIPCEVNGEKAVDIHHIHGRGKGKDVIENLMAVCRKHHDAAEGKGNTYLHPDMMQIIHNNFLKLKT